MSGSVIGTLLALTTAIFWGALPIAMKQVLEVMSPATIVWYRFITAFLGLGLWLLWRKNLPSLNQMRLGKGMLLLLAAIGLSGNFILFNTALSLLSPAVVQVIIQLAPVVMLLASAWLFKEKLGAHQIIGVIALFAGLLLFFNENLVELISSLGAYTIGVITAVSAALVWVIYGLAQKRLLQDFGSAQILFMVYGLCALFLTPFADIGQIELLNQRQAMMLLFCCINTLVGYGAFAEALARWQSAPVSAIITLAPLFTLLFVELATLFWPTIIAPIALNPLGYLGAFVVVLGAMCCAAGHKLVRTRSIKNEICR